MPPTPWPARRWCGRSPGRSSLSWCWCRRARTRTAPIPSATWPSRPTASRHWHGWRVRLPRRKAPTDRCSCLRAAITRRRCPASWAPFSIRSATWASRSRIPTPRTCPSPMKRAAGWTWCRTHCAPGGRASCLWLLRSVGDLWPPNNIPIRPCRHILPWRIVRLERRARATAHPVVSGTRREDSMPMAHFVRPHIKGGTMDRFTNPPHLDLKVYDPHYPYGPNVLGAHDALALPLHDRASYERACALFGVVPKSNAEIMNRAEVFEYEEFPPGEWAALGRNGRVAMRLGSAYYFETPREKL